MEEINVSLGCGMRKPKGFIGIDCTPYKDVDYVLDIGTHIFPFKDASISYIECEQIFEHLNSKELIHCMNECFRVLKPNGSLYVSVPRWGTEAWLMHPEHKMHWSVPMISFFLPPANGIDPHGYLKGFWNAEWDTPGDLLNIHFYPNKPGNPKFPYKEWKKYEDTVKEGEQI